jgi:hypothetical protein
MQSNKLIITKPNKPVGVKQAYLLIPISDEGQLGGIVKLIQRATFFYFTKTFQFCDIKNFIPLNQISATSKLVFN